VLLAGVLLDLLDNLVTIESQELVNVAFLEAVHQKISQPPELEVLILA